MTDISFAEKKGTSKPLTKFAQFVVSNSKLNGKTLYIVHPLANRRHIERSMLPMLVCQKSAKLKAVTILLPFSVVPTLVQQKTVTPVAFSPMEILPQLKSVTNTRRELKYGKNNGNS